MPELAPSNVTVDPDFAVGDGRPPSVRLVRGAHGAPRLHRHLRARSPDRGRDGYRTDVLDLVRELGVTAVRYPGGNFVSGYRWEDGVGPVERAPGRASTWPGGRGAQHLRPGRVHAVVRRSAPSPSWRSTWAPAACAEAAELLEYCNHPGGTALSDRRRAHGAERAVRHPHLVPGQRDGRAVADRRTRPPRSTAGSPPRPPRPCGWWTPTSSWSPAAAPARACPPSPPGRRRSSSTLRPRRLRVDARLLRGARRRPRRASWPARSKWTGLIDERRGDHRPRRRPSAQPTTGRTIAFDEWNVWSQRLHSPAVHARTGGEPARLMRGRLRRHRRRRRRVAT